MQRLVLVLSAGLASVAVGAAQAQSVVVTQPDGSQQATPLAPSAPQPPPPGRMPPPGPLGGVTVGEGIAAPNGPPPLAIAGDGTRQAADCAGRDVQIDGSAGEHVLRGGCRSIAIRGSRNVVTAEIAPGTRIAMHGDDNQVAFVVLGEGPNPIVSSAGINDRAWRVRELGATPHSGTTVGPEGVAVTGGGARVTEMNGVPQTGR